jgi:hypothetical protein
MSITQTQFEREVVPLFQKKRATADYLAEAQLMALRLGRDGKVLTVDDVRRVLPVPKGVDGRVLGHAFPRNEWERLGYGPGTRRVSHGRPLCSFRRW